MMLSAFFFCTMTVFVKLAGNEIGTMQIVLMRGIFTLIVTYFLIWKNNVHPFGNNKKILIFRGMVGTIALFLVFESIQRFSIPEATVIQYLYPIFTAILASFIISEYVGKVLYLSIIFGLFGVYIILDLPFQKEIPNVNFVDVAIAIAGSFLTAVSYVSVRRASKLGESPYVIMFYFPLFTVPFALVFMPGNWINPSPQEWFFLFLVGINSQLGQLFLTFGYRLLPASRAAIASYMQVPFSMLAGALIFSDSLTINFVIGSLMILVTIILTLKNDMGKFSKNS